MIDLFEIFFTITKTRRFQDILLTYTYRQNFLTKTEKVQKFSLVQLLCNSEREMLALMIV